MTGPHRRALAATARRLLTSSVMRHLVLAFALTTAACVEPAATTAALDEGATKGDPAPDPRLAST